MHVRRARADHRSWLALAAALAVALAAAIVAPANAGAWEPDPPRYEVGMEKNVAVTMSDGTVLRANVYYPTDPATGEAAKGPFPVIMVQTPYGKDTFGALSGGDGGPEAGNQMGPVPYFVKRGYIDVVVDVRGTGASHGVFDLWGPIQGRDGVELVDWAAKLPNSSGRVGLYGPAYMGVIQFMTAARVGRKSPLKALFPIITGNSVYRDVAFAGGILNSEFDFVAALGIFGAINITNPVMENPTDPVDLVQVEADHAQGLHSYSFAQATNILTGGDQAYDEDYWQARAPQGMLAKVVANRIPAFMVAGWYDLFQRGGPLNYSQLQNLYAGRPQMAPMAPDQRATGRYQLLQGPWFHLTAGTGVQVYRFEMAWFDRWLKGRRTGIEETTRPLHVITTGGNRWVDTTRFPFTEAKPRTYYLGGGPSGSGAPSRNDGTLTSERPAAATGSDEVAFVGAASPCTLASEQWSAGVTQLVLETGSLPPDPCTQDDRTIQTGPGALTYTTEPMRRDVAVAGPIAASVYATSTRPDVELVATVQDVAPDGTSKPLTAGALLGSFRKLDRARSWRARDGRLLLPYHPYTRASVRPVKIGSVTRFDIEVSPTVAEIPAGHRLRLTLATSDTPHLMPIPEQLANLVGGVYQVQRNKAAASYLEIPIAPAAAFTRCAGQDDLYRQTAPGGQSVTPPRVRCTPRRARR